MLTLVADAVERYAAERSPEESALFRELVKVTHEKTDAPQMQVGRLEGAFLRLMVRIAKAKRVLEFGTFTGYSALAMAEALPDDGELITLDVDPVNTAIAKDFWARSPHGRKIALKLGKAAQAVKDLKGPFDLVFIDADKPNYVAYWEASVPLVPSGGVLLADNVLWNGQVVDPQDDGGRAIAGFNDHVRADARVESAILTLRDGVTLAVKK